MDALRVFGQRFHYRYRIQLFLLRVLASSLYADLPIALTIVHFDGTPIHSPNNSLAYSIKIYTYLRLRCIFTNSHSCSCEKYRESLS